jgi:SAM-dependent methyltransferase
VILNFLREIVHIILPTQKPLFKYLKSISLNYKNLDILEIGSGNTEKKQSVITIFKEANTFLQTDIKKEYNHMFLDVTKPLEIKNKFDLVICTNVLEHIFETNLAIANLKKLVKKGGHLFVSVPFIYPLHDEPADYWRFTEHSLKILFKEFEIIEFKKTGLRQFPTQYMLLLELP